MHFRREPSLCDTKRTKNLVAKLWSNGMIRSRQGSVIVFRSNVFGGCLDVWKRERGAFFGLSFQSSFVYYWLWINQSSNDSCLSYLPANQGDGLSHLPTNRPLRPIDLIRNQRICRQVDDLFTTFFVHVLWYRWKAGLWRQYDKYRAQVHHYFSDKYSIRFIILPFHKRHKFSTCSITTALTRNFCHNIFHFLQ